MKNKVLFFLFFVLTTNFLRCGDNNQDSISFRSDTLKPDSHSNATLSSEDKFFGIVMNSALESTTRNISYDPSYFRIDYPNGDIPPDKGVCTDVIIRSYRAAGVDLQVKIHEDKKKSPKSYPKKWRGKRPDKNIDHRRVLNQMAFFKREGADLPITNNPKDYKPGDLVSWNLGGAVTHIGIIVDEKSSDGLRYKIVHNIGAGPQLEDVLFDWKIIGHYRYYPK